MKTYVADTPLNSASITPKKDFVILGGGQDAMGVTQTDGMQYQPNFARLFLKWPWIPTS
jgi:hypothetical protein